MFTEHGPVKLFRFLEVQYTVRLDAIKIHDRSPARSRVAPGGKMDFLFFWSFIDFKKFDGKFKASKNDTNEKG